MAMTLDGKIATAAGESQWVTGPAARRRVQRLRQWADAILVGGETLRQDNPALTVRTPQDWPRQPRKFVWSRRPPTAFPQSLKIFADPANPPEFVAPRTPQEWREWLQELGRRPLTALLLEGGGELAAAALHAGAVDRLEFHIAPKILGGRAGRPVVGGPDPDRLAAALGLQELRFRRLGDDWLATARPQPPPQP
jgi:diaminohydroxyphosphoribosylaminopyrimidine deaminase/5-amino-6-(5-phosphoribosylamino)uracil reductase